MRPDAISAVVLARIPVPMMVTKGSREPVWRRVQDVEVGAF
ncbi:hypothetical protein NHF46_08015 [Arthrobacter alpinus]|nr:hypothetical protein [Arthrobacter alpinus]